MASNASSSVGTTRWAVPISWACSGPPSSWSVTFSPMADSTTDGPDSAMEDVSVITMMWAVPACSAESP